MPREKEREKERQTDRQRERERDMGEGMRNKVSRRWSQTIPSKRKYK